LDDLFVESLEVASERLVLFLDYSFQGCHRFWMATRSCKVPGEQLTQLTPGGNGAWSQALVPVERTFL
jgi:hypothetical protein